MKAISYSLKTKEDGSYDPQEWMGDAKPILKKENPLANLPWVRDPIDKVQITQSNAAMSYLAKKLGMYGNTVLQEAECDQLLCELADLASAMTRFAYSDGTKDSAEELLKSQIKSGRGNLNKIESWLKKKFETSDNKEFISFLVGESATAPDFKLFELVEQYSTMAKHFGFDDKDPCNASVCPHLSSFYFSFKALKNNESYFNSPFYNLPFNNRMAKFGSAPFISGNSFDKDAPFPEFQLEQVV